MIYFITRDKKNVVLQNHIFKLVCVLFPNLIQGWLFLAFWDAVPDETYESWDAKFIKDKESGNDGESDISGLFTNHYCNCSLLYKFII
jgi:hypothetical protein